MKRGNWIEVNVDLQALTAADRNRRGAIGFGDVGVIGEGIGHVERSIDSCGRWLRFRPGIWSIRVGMGGIPRLGACRKEVCAGHQSGNLIGSLVVGLRAVSLPNLVNAITVVVIVERYRGMAHGFPGFVQDFAGNDCRWRESQNERFGLDARAGHDRGGKLVMLIVGSGNVPALRTMEIVLPRGYFAELELAIFGSDKGLKLLRIPGVSECEASASQRMAVGFTHDGSSDSVAVAGCCLGDARGLRCG